LNECTQKGKIYLGGGLGSTLHCFVLCCTWGRKQKNNLKKKKKKKKKRFMMDDSGSPNPWVRRAIPAGGASHALSLMPRSGASKSGGSPAGGMPAAAAGMPAGSGIDGGATATAAGPHGAPVRGTAGGSVASFATLLRDMSRARDACDEQDAMALAARLAEPHADMLMIQMQRGAVPKGCVPPRAILIRPQACF
jgi:hypothetical protein